MKFERVLSKQCRVSPILCPRRPWCSHRTIRPMSFYFRHCARCQFVSSFARPTSVFSLPSAVRVARASLAVPPSASRLFWFIGASRSCASSPVTGHRLFYVPHGYSCVTAPFLDKFVPPLPAVTFRIFTWPTVSCCHRHIYLYVYGCCRRECCSSPSEGRVVRPERNSLVGPAQIRPDSNSTNKHTNISSLFLLL